MRVPSREAARQADGGRVAAIRGDRALASKGPIISCQPDGDSGSVCAISARLGQTVCPLSGIEYQIGEIEPPSCDPEPFKGFREAHERRAFLQKAFRASAQAPRASASSPARYSAGLVEGIGPGFHYRESGSPPNTRTRMRKVSSATAGYRKVPLSTRHSLGSR